VFTCQTPTSHTLLAPENVTKTPMHYKSLSFYFAKSLAVMARNVLKHKYVVNKAMVDSKLAIGAIFR